MTDLIFSVALLTVKVLSVLRMGFGSGRKVTPKGVLAILQKNFAILANACLARIN